MLIDVRTPEEYQEEHAPGAINLPLNEIEAGNLGELSTLPKDTPLMLYCRSGYRSGIAQGLLKELGFQNVENLGGLSDLSNL